jgi:Tol biopolymer transport system component
LKGRDLAIVAAVLLLGGFALADAFRSRGEESSAPPTQSAPDGRAGPEPRPDAPEDWPAGRLRGTLVFTDAEGCRVRVIGLGGGKPRRLSRHGGGARWSPDGRVVLFTSDRQVPRSHPCRQPNTRYDCPQAIYVVGADGSGERRLTAHGVRGYPSWDPTGRRFAFALFDADGRGRVYVFHRGTGRAMRLTNTNSGRETNPAWSPRGDLIAFQYEFRGSGADVYVARPDGRGQRRLGTNAPHASLGSERDGGPVWSRDGRWLAYTGYARDGEPGIFVIDVRRGDQQRVTTRRSVDDVAWSPGSRLIAFAARVFEDGMYNLRTDLFVVGRDGRGLRRLTHPGRRGGAARSPAWSSDGDWIAYASEIAGGVWLISPDGRRHTRLTPRAGMQPAWRPRSG